jgi:hypothetical protein
VKLTADTITDEQILRIYAEVTAHEGFQRNDTVDGKRARDCIVALGMGDFVYPDPQRRAARARIAEILNARAEQSK